MHFCLVAKHHIAYKPHMNTALNVIVVEDDPLILDSLKLLLADSRLSCYGSSSALLADKDASLRAHVILLDLCNPSDPTGERSIESIPEIKLRFREAKLIVQSGISDIALMRRCIQRGATRFILKEHLSFEIPVLMTRIQETLSQKSLVEKMLLGQSAPMRSLREELLNLRLESNLDVLFEGETGTGKELCARALHVSGPFVAVNCSAIPPELFEAEFFGAEKGSYTGSSGLRLGHFESAGAGVLFLDEIQSLPLAQQAKLLRVLESRTFTRVGSSQERSFKARIVSASNRNLKEAVEKGQFREDLFYRLASIHVSLPPLRARRDDIELLAKVFISDVDDFKHFKFSKEAIAYLSEHYDWPGNVRELRGLVRALCVKSALPIFDVPEIEKVIGHWDRNSTQLDPKAIAKHTESKLNFDWSKGFDSQITDFEKVLLAKALSEFGMQDARDKLQMSRSRYYEKIKQHGLKSLTSA
jgi:DNA-binding NtrC family response regulator